MRIDLHGYHIHVAWKHFNYQIEEAYFGGKKKCIVITGQGAMMHEFPQWAQNHPRIRDWSQHRHNSGSFIVKIKKRS